MKKNFQALLFLWMACLMMGCAMTRGILNVPFPTAANPAAGPSVKIVRVSDERTFELKPRIPSIPSIKDGNITDKTITARAIARKRNGYGAAMGDILLPEGETVEGLVKAAVTRACRESGYRVVDQNETGFPSAIPLEASVQQFWAWFTPGFWTIDTDFIAEVKIVGDVSGFKNNASSVEGHYHKSGMAAGSGMWMKTITEGVEDLVANIKTRLAADKTANR